MIETYPGYSVSKNFVTIYASHPYFLCLAPEVSKNGNEHWEVRWRDFWTVKQDTEFHTEEEAHNFSASLFEAPKTVPFEVGYEDLRVADEFWRDFASSIVRKKVSERADRDGTGEDEAFKRMVSEGELREADRKYLDQSEPSQASQS